MSAVLDPQVHLDAFVAAVSTAITPYAAYAFSDLPGADDNPDDLPSHYALLGVYRMAPVGQRASGESDVLPWELEISHAGRSVGEANWLYARISARLNDGLVTIGGESVQVTFVTDEFPEREDVRYIGRSTWRYAI